LRAQGFRVGEVPGACFCCKFDDLVRTVESLRSEQSPDVVIAEPVGSCTDLVATVVEPLRQLHGDRYELSPLAVLLKPEHGRKILGDEPGMGFSAKAAYIFLKQIEEADVVAINKVDKLSAAQREELTDLVARRFPEKEVLAISARRGDGFQQFIDAVDRCAPAHQNLMNVDYDVYAEGEAELGWLNCRVHLLSPNRTEFVLDEVVLGLVDRLRTALARSGHEPAHLKVLGETAGSVAMANLVGSETAAELSVPSASRVADAGVIVNARVAMDPEGLERIVRAAVAELAGDCGLQSDVRDMQRFRPGRPVPTHRVTV
ncbi:MAG: cobalamin biosynthesis protein P47K, partial [Planctomycetes bacterium]|nr:cobalamin biosynthesis protein P47K [Planctomycetota bacterium]